MKITKFGQCCLLVEINGKRILTDPGRFTVAQNSVDDIDLVFITHEHFDHLHTDSLLTILKNNPKAKVVTNSSVAKILSTLDVSCEIIEGRDVGVMSGITIEAYDGKHAEIFGDFGLVQNTGYFIAKKLFYPGDSYVEPDAEVEVLALPVSGPWCRSADAISYALRIKPVKAFPVHDWILNDDGIVLVHRLFAKQLEANNINFIQLKNGETSEF